MWPRITLGLILAIFALCGLARLNPFCLLEPDTPDYLFTARALATFEGYREIDDPAGPLHAFRPPGLPLLLAPLARFAPYDVETAKIFILALALALLALVYVYAKRISGAWGGVAATALVASSPYTLLHATEVVSEIPYIVAVMAVLLLATRREDRVPRRNLIYVALLLTLAPLVRTIGLAIVGAIAAWSLTRKARWSWLPAAGVALTVNLLWAWRNAHTGATTYFASISHDLGELGLSGYAGKIVATAGYYADRFVDVLLPGLYPGQPLYERFLLEPAAHLGGLWGLGMALAAVVVLLALLGMFARRGSDGAPAAIYALLFSAALVVYPPRHERLAWPLVPLVWIYVPAGLALVRDRLARRWDKSAALLPAAAAFFCLALTAWQGVSSGAMLAGNARWRGAKESFHRDVVPPMYYADWAAAGTWLRNHTPSNTRILTRHSDVGFTSRRHQDSSRFEEASPQALEQRIRRFGARYLVVPTTRFAWGVPSNLLTSSPVYEYEPVHRAGDVLVVEIRPNRAGIVHWTDPELPARIEACREATRKHPDRPDLRRRLAELLHEAGRSDEALAGLKEFGNSHGDDVHLVKTLAVILLDVGRYEEALDALHRAERLPKAEFLARSIRNGIRRARDGLQRARGGDPRAEARALAEAALQSAGYLSFPIAWRYIERALSLAPEDPPVMLAQATLLERVGRFQEAALVLEPLARRGGAEPASRLVRLARLRALEAGAAGSGPDAAEELAVMHMRSGFPGKALAVLEAAAERHAGSRQIRMALADLYLFYAMPERSEPLYREILEDDPANENARKGLDAIRRLLEPARY